MKNFRQDSWVFFITLFLGFWLLLGFTPFGYKDSLLSLSDILSGSLVVFLSFLLIVTRFFWIRWLICSIGVWLQLAPLIFWASSPAAYLNDTLIGILLIAFSVLIPPDQRKGEIPPGWSYNPSSWAQRFPIFVLGCIGWFIARYLASYQLGYIHSVWDPFFKEGTWHVITSKISKDFPVSDAGLGAFAYTLETLMCCKGNASRWKTMPWIVVSFGILVIPLGFISILLIISQPLVVGWWCGLCLICGFSMLFMIALTIDEVVAVCQFLAFCKRKKKALWTIFWCGEDVISECEAEQKLCPMKFLTWKSLFFGFYPCWNLILSLFLGVWLMIFPSLFVLKEKLADSTYVVGALVIVFSLIAMAEVIRILRVVNIFFGLIVVFLAFNFSMEDQFNFQLAVSGCFLIFLNLFKGNTNPKNR